MKMAADVAKVPVEMVAVLAMAPVAMVAPANVVVMVAPAPVAVAAAAGAPVAMAASVHVETAADAARAPLEKAAAAPVETEVAAPVDKAEGRSYCLESTPPPPPSSLSACLCHPGHLVHHLWTALVHQWTASAQFEKGHGHDLHFLLVHLLFLCPHGHHISMFVFIGG